MEAEAAAVAGWITPLERGLWSGPLVAESSGLATAQLAAPESNELFACHGTRTVFESGERCRASARPGIGNSGSSPSLGVCAMPHATGAAH